MADASKWIFRGEGNACLVLVNKEEKRAYRLAKSSHWGKGHLATSSVSKIDRIHEELQMVIDYMREVMQPLLSARFVLLPELCLIAGGLTEEARQIQPSRPAQRKGKEVDPSTVDPTTLSALVMPDLCYIRDQSSLLQTESATLSVEIKPKKAFIHDRDVTLSEKQSQVCKFCMHQRLKMIMGNGHLHSTYRHLFYAIHYTQHLIVIWLKKVSGQSPVDIAPSISSQDISFQFYSIVSSDISLETSFQDISNDLSHDRVCQICNEIFQTVKFTDRGRMKQALLALAETPQNNLRICQNGEEILGAWNKGDLHEILEKFFGEFPNGYMNGLHKQRTLQTFLDLLLEALLSVSETDYAVGAMPQATSHPVQYCSNSRCSPDPNMFSECCDLPTGCVLERILSTQKLDDLDIDGVYPLYLQLEKYFGEHPEMRCKKCLDGPYNHSDWLQACLEGGCGGEELIMEHPVQTMVTQIKRFLVSKTVQDCSIMVALQKVLDSANEDSVGPCLKDDYGRLFRFSVSIVDLDPKPFCKIPVYHKQNRQIMKAYRDACD